MKYFRNFLSQFEINITAPMSETSICPCYIIMISYSIISYIKQFIAYSAFITGLKSLSFMDIIRFLLKCCFIIFFAILTFFTNCFNKFIIDTNNFEGKTLRNMYSVFLIVWIIIFLITFDPFQNTFKISINFKWYSYMFNVIFKFDWTTC